MIIFRKLKATDKINIKKFIFNEGDHYKEYLQIGWSLNQIIKQLNKQTNFSFGVFYNDTLISFILGDLFNIEKISEYEILLIYVSNNFRKKGLGTKLINKIEENNNCLKKIYLEVSKHNISGLSFYNKMNFKEIYTRKKYFFLNNKRVDAIVMSKTYLT